MDKIHMDKSLQVWLEKQYFSIFMKLSAWLVSWNSAWLLKHYIEENLAFSSIMNVDK